MSVAYHCCRRLLELLLKDDAIPHAARGFTVACYLSDRIQSAAPDPAFSKPRGNAPATRLTATLTDGTTVKFRSRTQGRWQPAKTDAILKALWDFEHTKDMRGLLGQMAFGA